MDMKNGQPRADPEAEAPPEESEAEGEEQNDAEEG